MTDVGKLWLCLICAMILFIGAGVGDLFGIWDIPFWPILAGSGYLVLAAVFHMLIGSRLVIGLLVVALGFVAVMVSWGWSLFSFWLFIALTVAMWIVSIIGEPRPCNEYGDDMITSGCH